MLFRSIRSVAGFLWTDVRIIHLTRRRFKNADKTYCFAIPIIFVRPAAKVGYIFKFIGDFHFHAKSRQLGQSFYARRKLVFNDSIAACQHGVGDSLFGFHIRQVVINDNLHLSIAFVFAGQFLQLSVISGKPPHSASAVHAIAKIIVRGRAPEIRFRRLFDQFFILVQKRNQVAAFIIEFYAKIFPENNRSRIDS